MYEKIGAHVIHDLPLASVVATLDGRQPPVMTLTDCSAAYIRAVREAWPDTVIVVRYTDWPRHLGRMWQLPQEGILLQSRNEPVVNSLAEAARLCEQELEWLDQCHQRGFSAALLTPSVGSFAEPLWIAFRALLLKMGRDDRVAVHEYWVDGDGIANPWHCARWQLIDELADIPLVVTECGRDVVEGQGAPGWRGNINAERYLAEIERYNTLLRSYPNVLGATLFTLGDDPNWTAYDVAPVWPRICQQANWSARTEPPPRRIPTVNIAYQDVIIRELDIEEYLKAVVPAEVYASWPQASLEAQAVAARTWALASLGRHGDEGFDFCTGPHCQVWDRSRLDDRTDRAVEATAGIVGTWDYQIMPTWYSAYCGGRTKGDWGKWLRARDDCPCAALDKLIAGHQRGMCQWGAKLLADAGYDWQQILDFYFRDMLWIRDYASWE